VFERVRLENLLVDSAKLLRLVDEGTGIEFSKLGQVESLLLLQVFKEGRRMGRHT